MDKKKSTMSKFDAYACFPYYAPIGGFAKEKEQEMYISRRDPLTKKVKVVPEMLTPITHGRKMIPVHQLLEDDWRAFKSASHFHSRLARLPSRVQGTSYPIYASNVPPFGGFLYSHHQACGKIINSQLKGKVTKRSIPTSVFQGPFQSNINVPDCAKSLRLRQRQAEMFYPSSALVLGTYESDNAEQMTIYNEPDVIPQESLGQCFDDPLMIRTMKRARVLQPLVDRLLR